MPPSSGESLREPQAAQAVLGFSCFRLVLAWPETPALQLVRTSWRLSRNTACSPIRFQNHHGALKRSARPQALRATALSILAPATPQSWRKSLMVQKWILGVSHQL